jgi:hypothetical protein
MIIDPALADVDPLRAALRADIRANESEIVRRLAAKAALTEDARERVAARASLSPSPPRPPAGAAPRTRPVGS